MLLLLIKLYLPVLKIKENELPVFAKVPEVRSSLKFKESLSLGEDILTMRVQSLNSSF